MSTIEWSTTFRPLGVPETELVESLEAFYRSGFDNLRKLLRVSRCGIGRADNQQAVPKGRAGPASVGATGERPRADPAPPCPIRPRHSELRFPTLLLPCRRRRRARMAVWVAGWPAFFPFPASFHL